MKKSIAWHFRRAYDSIRSTAKCVVCCYLLFVLLGCGDAAVNLRTIHADSGTEYTESFSVVMDGDLTMKALGETKEGTFEFDTRTETEFEILEVNDGLLVRWTEKLKKDSNTNRFLISGKEEINREEPSPLLGVLVRMTVQGGKASAELLDLDRPTPDQVAELARLDGGPEYEIYPDEKVAPGDTWSLNIDGIRKLLGDQALDIYKASGEAEYLRNEDYEGVRCAVVEFDIEMQGLLKPEGEGNQKVMNAKMEVKVTQYKSLESGLKLREKAEGDVRFVMEVAKDIEMVLDGTMSSESEYEIDE